MPARGLPPGTRTWSPLARWGGEGRTPGLTVALHGRPPDTVCAEDVHVHQLRLAHELKHDVAHLVKRVHGQTALLLQLPAGGRAGDPTARCWGRRSASPPGELAGLCSHLGTFQILILSRGSGSGCTGRPSSTAREPRGSPGLAELSGWGGHGWAAELGTSHPVRFLLFPQDGNSHTGATLQAAGSGDLGPESPLLTPVLRTMASQGDAPALQPAPPWLITGQGLQASSQGPLSHPSTSVMAKQNQAAPPERSDAGVSFEVAPKSHVCSR